MEKNKASIVGSIALQKFTSLEEFNNYFIEYDQHGNASLIPDDIFIVPNILGDNGTTKQHVWSEFPSEKDPEDISVYDESTSHATYQSKSGRAAVKEIRKVLIGRKN